MSVDFSYMDITGTSEIPWSTTIGAGRLEEWVRKLGAETMKEGIYKVAEYENWVKAER